MYYYKRIKNTPAGEVVEYIKSENQSVVSFNVEISEEEYHTATRIPNLKKEMEQLKSELAFTDYIACKIAEGSATQEEYADEIEKRREIRARINEIEAELSGLTD